MSILLISVAGGLLAFELWGSVDLIAKVAIRIVTAPLPQPWKSIRRLELEGLIRPCKGDRRIVALVRVIATAVTLTASDILHHRLRRRSTRSSAPTSQPIRLLVNTAMLTATVFIALSVLAWLLGAAPWQVGASWGVLVIAVLCLRLSFPQSPVSEVALVILGLVGAGIAFLIVGMAFRTVSLPGRRFRR